ncbi:hypothetical protein J2X63_002819 [Agromyces sp. 3263]|uniref:hypothetical protein n=1 Tax=Agromyces sp. 3263 TaxID=2817750 RepID=UPI002860D206|nr:hypothetical protein [Agromyces sp. 3263]MDR6907111.1 hypothetical protein [Agromyces sp. 3263]
MRFRPVHRPALLAATILSAAALAGCAGTTAGAGDGEAGGLQLVVRDGHLREVGAACSGARPYLGVHKGAQLSLHDDEGRQVFAAVLGDGEAVKVDDIDYGTAPRIPTFCRFSLGIAELDDGTQYSVSIDGQVVAEHEADAADPMVFVPALADPTIEGTE